MRRFQMATSWPQADAGTLPDSTVYEVVICPGPDATAAAILADHPGAEPGTAHSAFFPDPVGEHDGTFYFGGPPQLAILVHEAGHAAIDTFVRRGLPIPDGDDDMTDAEEAFVHFLGMLVDELASHVIADRPLPR